MASHKNTPLAYRRAKKLRQQFSPYEIKLWRELRQVHKTMGIKFRRQQPISPYIVDFACMEAKLVIELDGASHDASGQYDKKREIYLKQRDFTVLRFNNRDVIENLNGIMSTIVSVAKNRIDPSPAKTKGLLAQAQVFATSPARGEV